MTVTADNGCDGYGIVFVDEVYCSAIEISSSQDSLCEGGSLELTASAGFESYLWSTGTAAPLVTITETGVYTVEAADMNGCLAYGEIEVAAYNISIQPERVAIGPGESLELEVTGQHTDYEWTNGTSMSTLMINQTGAYGVTVTNQAGCVMSSTIEVLDRCDNRIYFGGNYYANGDALVFNTVNTEFGIVFLEIGGFYADWDDFIWTIGGKHYHGKQIALRFIDFFQGPGEVTPSSITLTNGHCGNSITVNVSVQDINLANYYPPDKLTVHIINQLGAIGTTDLLNSIKNHVKNIYESNEIEWVDFQEINSENLEGFPEIDRIMIWRTFGEHPGISNYYRRSYIRFFQYTSTLLNDKGQGFIVAHELLHQLLNDLGLLLFGNPFYFQSGSEHHIHEDNQYVSNFGINLNTNARSSLFNRFPPQGGLYLKARRIYPVQLFYVKKAMSYFYLLEPNLMNRLSPSIGPSLVNFRPDVQAWRILKSRFKRIKEKEGVNSQNTTSVASDLNPATFELNNLFQF